MGGAVIIYECDRVKLALVTLALRSKSLFWKGLTKAAQIWRCVLWYKAKQSSCGARRSNHHGSRLGWVVEGRDYWASEQIEGGRREGVKSPVAHHVQPLVLQGPIGRCVERFLTWLGEYRGCIRGSSERVYWEFISRDYQGPIGRCVERFLAWKKKTGVSEGVLVGVLERALS